MSVTTPPADASDTLYLVDGSGFIYRAYFGLRASMTAKDGTPTNAVYGFTRLLLNLLRDRNPGYVAVAFDPSGPVFRNDIYPEYKANRKSPPDDLRPQFSLCRDVVKALGIPGLLQQGYEADDMIGTLAARWTKSGRPCVIVTADKDMMQLITPTITMWDGKEKITDAAGVKERFGVEPERVIDILGLAGDSSDNIPGVPGIGEKTAAKYLQTYPDMDTLLEAAAAGKVKGKRGQSLADFADQARLSRVLATIKTDATIECTDEDLRRTPPDEEELAVFFRAMNFRTFLKEFNLEHKAAKQIDKSAYALVQTEAEFDSVLRKIRRAGRMSIDLKTTGLDTRTSTLVGVALAWHAGDAVYVPVAHTGKQSAAPSAEEQAELIAKETDEAPIEAQVDLIAKAPEAVDAVVPQLSEAWVLKRLKPLIENPDFPKISQNVKLEWQVLQTRGIDYRGAQYDTLLSSYLMNPNRTDFTLPALSSDLLGHKMITLKDVVGKKGKAADFAGVDLESAMQFAAEDADVALRLALMMAPDLTKAGLDSLNTDLELALAPVIGRMELTGVKVDSAQLQAKSAEYAVRIKAMTAEIHTLAGKEFTIGSTKQLGEILFEDMGLPVLEKTPKGKPKVDERVLSQLALQHPLPAKILAWRQLTKLKSTYLDALPKLVHPDTGRIHSSFRQAVAATGRISSSDPNLQNIPIRTEEGREIRRAFITEPGWKLISADYSQVELRILAHFSQDPLMMQAFRDGIDIHTRTASEVFDTPIFAVSSEQRGRAKMVNYGLAYGLTSFGLAQRLGIERREADKLHRRYFERFPAVKAFQAKLVEEAREHECAKTLLGRIRPLPHIGTRKWNDRKEAERLAINTPIQGTGADILKKAMLNLDRALADKQARMVLTVHDELVVEAPEDEVEAVAKIMRHEMEHAVELSVPLVVDVGIGDNWAEIH